MAVLTRINNFAPGSLIVSQQVDDEFDQLVNILSGVSTNKNVVIKFSDGATPPLVADMLGAGPIQQWKNNGAEQARVNNDGSFRTTRQFISTLTTGTKPIDVASTTVCTNLNADLLDGINGSQFVRNDAVNQGVTGDFSINGTAPTLYMIDSDGEDLQLTVDGDVAELVFGGNSHLRFRGGANDDIQVLRKTTFSDEVVISSASPKLTFTDTTGGDDDYEIVVNGDVFTLRPVGGSDTFKITTGSPNTISMLADVSADATGSSTGAPRVMGVTNLTTGTAARVTFGDAFNSFGVSNGGRMIVQSFNGLRIHGHTFGVTTGSEAPVGFSSSSTADPHVEFIGSVGGFSENVGDNVHVQIRGASSMSAGVTPFFRCVTSGGTDRFSVLENGNVTIAGTQVLTSRRTGWTAATGTATRTTFATGSVTLPVLAEHLKALIDDLITHGIIGT
jgi:hypothetical protein